MGTGLAPQGLCIDSATDRTFVKNFMDRTVSVLETGALFRDGAKTVAESTVPTVASEALPLDVLRGKQVFYNAGDPRMSAEGYLSCASCHADGGHDSRVWDFTGRGEGLRNTTTLRGRGGMAHGNVHWSANFDEIQDFEHDIRGAFGGSGFLSASEFAATNQPLGTPKAGLDSDLDALAAYVASLGRETVPRSPFRNPDGTLTAEAVAGRAVFTREGCGSCHAGVNLSDSSLGAETLHDVGTLRDTSGQRLSGTLAGIDTPTLYGLWNTAPYFHDGSAPTLNDVFRVAGGNLLPAEAASTAGAASVVTNYVDLNNDDTVHGRAYAELESTGASLTFHNVEGGPQGGQGALEIRYSRGYGPVDIEVLVNGVSHPMTLPDTGNEPGWRHVNWETVRLENIALTSGPANTIVITSSAPYVGLSIDDILVTPQPYRARAFPHRRVLSLPQSERQALVAYLQQLDAQPGAEPTIFVDGFESGGTTIWTGESP